MTHDEMVALIRAGIPRPGGTWADFGAGTGNFTLALRDLVGSEATIYAIDRDRRALNRLRARWDGDATLHTLHADFTQPLDLPPLDGALMANALHFVRQQKATLQHVKSYLRPGGVLLLVEYDVGSARPATPHPMPYKRFEKLAQEAGFAHVQRVGARTSPRTGITMYAGVAHAP